MPGYEEMHSPLVVLSAYRTACILKVKTMYLHCADSGGGKCGKLHKGEYHCIDLHVKREYNF